MIEYTDMKVNWTMTIRSNSTKQLSDERRQQIFDRCRDMAAFLMDAVEVDSFEWERWEREEKEQHRAESTAG